MKNLFYLLAFLLCYTCYSQSIFFYDVDTTNFPIMKAKFYAFDKDGKSIIDFSMSDFEIKENGLQRTVTNVSCPSLPKLDSNLSLALSMDASGSMLYIDSGKNLFELSKITAQEILKTLTMPPAEIALQTCNVTAYILQDFTTDTSKLMSKIKTLKAEGENDFMEQLLNPDVGILNIAKTGKGKRVALILTDGLGSGLSYSELQQCIDTCKKYDIKFYAVIYKNAAEKEFWSITESFRQLANITGAYLFDGITQEKSAKDIAYRVIQQIIQGGIACELEWKSESICNYEIRDVEFFQKTLNLNGYLRYQIPLSSIAKLIIKPNSINFGRVKPKTTKDTTITLTAKNADFQINNIHLKSGSDLFRIIDANYPIIIPKNTSKEIRLKYSPIDSNLNFAFYEIETNICPVYFNAKGGFILNEKNQKTLKLTSPNGGEILVAGSDTLITWEGVAATDTCILEYSIDSEKTWVLITEKATGLMYNWKNIHLPISNQCLIRIKQNTPGSSPGTPKIEWQKTYGGNSWDIPGEIRQTMDGGYIIGGYSNSDSDDVKHEGNYSHNSDYWVLKLDYAGGIEWQKCYGNTLFGAGPGESDIDRANSIKETNDGGFIIAGYSRTFLYSFRYWVVKITSNGTFEWQKSYKFGGQDYAQLIQQTSDDGYIVTGYTWSEIDSSGIKRKDDYLILKLNHLGEIEWQKSYGGTGEDYAKSTVQTSDGGYLIAGSSNSKDGDITGNKGYYDCWLVKLNSKGDLEWQKSFGGERDDVAQSIIQTNDGGYIVAGSTNSNEILGYHSALLNGDYWIMKLNNNFEIEWQKTYGGTGLDSAQSIQQTSDGGYIVAGNTNSFNGDVTGFHGIDDYWVIKLNSSGSLVWQKTLGGSGQDMAVSIQETFDYGYIIAGNTMSIDGDVITKKNRGAADYWIVKLASEGYVLQEDISDSVFSVDKPSAKSMDIDFNECFIGNNKDTSVVDFVLNNGLYKIRIDSIYFRGKDSLAFSLVSGTAPYNLEDGKGHIAEFKFTPLRDGLHEAEIVIITQTDTLVQNVKGIGVKKPIGIVKNTIDFGNVILNLGEYKDIFQVAAINNMSANSIKITKTIQSDPSNFDFTILAGAAPFILNPGDTAKLDLRFKPSNYGRISGKLEFYYDGFDSPLSIRLYGNCIDPTDVESQVSNIIGENFQIIPNPAENNVTISLKDIYKMNGNYYIYDYLGNLVIQGTIFPGTKELNISTKVMQSGIYSLVLEFPNEVKRMKLIINK